MAVTSSSNGLLLISGGWRSELASDISTSVSQRLYNNLTRKWLVNSSIWKKKGKYIRHSKRSSHKHFHRLVTPAAYDFIRHEVYTIHLVSVTR
jgi:hypothetical protein